MAETGVDEQPLRRFMIVVSDHQPAWQDTDAAFDDAHIAVELIGRDSRLREKAAHERERDGIGDGKQETHVIFFSFPAL